MYRLKPLSPDVPGRIPLVAEYCKKDEDIVSLYLFGSFSTGKNTPTSDIDLAVLLDFKFSRNMYWEKKLYLIGVFTQLLHTDEVDLVVLNDAPHALAYRVFREGKILYEKEESKLGRVNFQVKVQNMYFDFQPMERLIQKSVIERIKGGRFGGRS